MLLRRLVGRLKNRFRLSLPSFTRSYQAVIAKLVGKRALLYRFRLVTVEMMEMMENRDLPGSMLDLAGMYLSAAAGRWGSPPSVGDLTHWLAPVGSDGPSVGSTPPAQAYSGSAAPASEDAAASGMNSTRS